MPHLSRCLFSENICSNLLKQLQKLCIFRIWGTRYFLTSCETNLFVPQEESQSSFLFLFKRHVKQNKGGHIKKETHPLAKGPEAKWNVLSPDRSPAAVKVMLFLRHISACPSSVGGGGLQNPNPHGSDTGTVTLGKSLPSPSQQHCLPG